MMFVEDSSTLFLYRVAVNLICLHGEFIAVQLALSIEWIIFGLILGLGNFYFNLRV